MASPAVPVRLLRLRHAEGLPAPSRASAGSAGFDLRAALGIEIVIAPGARALVPTGWRLELPPGFEGQVRARSGLALRHGIALANGVGTIDSDYRGELAVILINLGAEPFVVRRGDRVAQLVVAPVAPVVWEEVAEIAESERGGGGFGSSGNR